MLLNGGFEQGATGWSLPGEAQAVSEGAREGRNCLRVSTRSPSWAMAGQDCQLPKGAKRVRLSGWMRTEKVRAGANPWEKARMQITFSDANGQLVGGYPPSVDIDGTTEWTFYSRDYEVPAQAVRVSLAVGLHNATGTVWYDDLRLEAYDMQGNALEAMTESRTDTRDWYPLDTSPDDYTQPAVVDLSRYLHKPAGKHGFLTVRNGKFVFEDGTPARFWGVNIVAGNVFMDKTTAERTAARLAKFGCNMVRLHHMDASWAQPNIFGNHP
ncbi:MAG: carbohydrate binding domain-containing protein, partial [bacterium]|nr:carbohydrate binding domain-containing protein [bacterium]